MLSANVCSFGEENLPPRNQADMISTSSLTRSEDTNSSMFRYGSALHYPTETEFTSIDDSVNTTFTKVSANRFQGDVCSISKQSVSSSSSRGKKEVNKIRAVGRGGRGNIIKTESLEVDYVDEADVLRRRRLLAQYNPRAKIAYTGRGGTGNILAASGSVPYDPSKDPDDEYEKIVQVEAQKKRMQQASSTGRGGSGNVRSISTDTMRPRSKSLSMFRKKNSRTDRTWSRPLTASTVGSNATSEHHELREHTLAPTFHTHTGNATPATPAIIPPAPSVSTGSGEVDQTDTTRLLHRLAISSAAPPQPVWRLQYPKQRPDMKQSRLKESIIDTEKRERKGKWWKKSTKKNEDGEYPSVVEAYAEQDNLEQSEPDRRHPSLATDHNLGRKEFQFHSMPHSISKKMDPIPISRMPRIPLRNPLIPSHVDYNPGTTMERSLSPIEMQILDEVRILAESKLHSDGHFDMSGLEEVLMQARHRRHQIIPIDSNSLTSFPPRAKWASQTKVGPNHEGFEGGAGHYRHLLRERTDYSQHRSAITQKIQDYHISLSPFVDLSSDYSLSSSGLDRDASDYRPAALSERDNAPSISGKSMERRERQMYQHQELPIIPHIQNQNFERHDAVFGHSGGIDETPRPSIRQLSMERDEENQGSGGMGEEGEDWCLHLVNEEEDYVNEDEEPYTSFIDI